jgi:hypothetical protein
MEGVAHMQFSFVFLGLVQWIWQHDAHLFSEFAPYSLSIQYCQVEMCFLDISLVPLSVCEGKKFAIWQQNNSNVPVDPVLEIPPEFDPDSAEFIFDISDYATEYRKKDA